MDGLGENQFLHYLLSGHRFQDQRMSGLRPRFFVLQVLGIQDSDVTVPNPRSCSYLISESLARSPCMVGIGWCTIFLPNWPTHREPDAVRERERASCSKIEGRRRTGYSRGAIIRLAVATVATSALLRAWILGSWVDGSGLRREWAIVQL